MFTKSFSNINMLIRKQTPKYSMNLSNKVSKQAKEKPAPKVAADVVNYLESTPDYETIRNNIPRSLLRKYKAPESMYLINKKTAKEIVDTVKHRLNTGSAIIEVNPGFGFLTEELLRCGIKPIHMYETSNNFSTYLTAIQSKYPGQTTLKIDDFFGMWKLAFKDKMDQGTRVQEMLGELYTEDVDRDVKIIGSMPGLSFVKHLITSIIFHNCNQLGRPDLFITMPGQHYEFLADNEIQLSKHKSVPALFQMLFDFKVLTSVPKVHFLPWTFRADKKKVTLMDEHRLYLVNITQKDKLPCPPDYLPLLWYFFKPHMFSKSTRVIPMLERESQSGRCCNRLTSQLKRTQNRWVDMEIDLGNHRQWIPGCGVWLITGQDPPDTNKDLAPGEDDAKLPHMTIFTEFGDLNLKQKITVFKKFISWPEFEQCQFRVTMLNNLPKFITQYDDDDKESMGTHIEEMDQSDVEHET